MSVKVYVIDLEDSVSVQDEARGMIGTNAYRAPEVTLGTSVAMCSVVAWELTGT